MSVGSIGGGGGGSYTLRRETISAREFKKGSPAKGRFDTGDVEVWRFTAKPDEPLLIHWKWQGQGQNVVTYDETGQQTNIYTIPIDLAHRYSLLKVEKPTTFLLVFTGKAGKGEYSVELLDLPGYGKGG